MINVAVGVGAEVAKHEPLPQHPNTLDAHSVWARQLIRFQTPNKDSLRVVTGIKDSSEANQEVASELPAIITQ